MLRHVMIPRTKGFVAAFRALGGGSGLASDSYIDAVYDLTIAYRGGVPSLWQYAQGHCREVHVHVRRVSGDELQASEEELSHWLLERFQEKDQLLEDFYSQGRFSEDPAKPAFLIKI